MGYKVSVYYLRKTSDSLLCMRFDELLSCKAFSSSSHSRWKWRLKTIMIAFDISDIPHRCNGNNDEYETCYSILESPFQGNNAHQLTSEALTVQAQLPKWYPELTLNSGGPTSELRHRNTIRGLNPATS